MTYRGAPPRGIDEASSVEAMGSVPPCSGPVEKLPADPRGGEALRLEPGEARFRAALFRVKRGQVFGEITPLLRRASALATARHVTSQAVRDLLRGQRGLTERVLSVARSAHYSRGERVTSLDEALLRLGPRTVALQLQPIVARRYASGQDPLLRRRIIDSLATGYAVGLVAAELARLTRRALPSEAFTAGLFHNIGQTFFLCTQAMRGEVVTPGQAGVRNGESSEAELALSVCDALGLSAVVVDLAMASPASPVGGLVGMAVWVVDRVVRAPAGVEVSLDAEGRALGIDDALLKSALTFSPGVRELVSSYGAVA